MKRIYIFTLMLCLFLTGCHNSDKSKNTEEPLVTIKDVVIDKVDEAAGTISVSYGDKSNPTKLVNVPLAEEVRVVASHILPGSVNNLPFRWEYVKNLQGKTVSIRMDITPEGLSITSIASGND